MTSPVAQGTHQRVFYRTKAEWAEAKAKELLAEASQLRFEPSMGQAIRARRKFDAVANLQREAVKFDRMAPAFRKRRM